MQRYYFEAAVVMDGDIPEKVRDRYAAEIAVDFEKALFGLLKELKIPQYAYNICSLEPALTREIEVDDLYIAKLRDACQFATITPVGAAVVHEEQDTQDVLDIAAEEFFGNEEEAIVGNEKVWEDVPANPESVIYKEEGPIGSKPPSGILYENMIVTDINILEDGSENITMIGDNSHWKEKGEENE